MTRNELVAAVAKQAGFTQQDVGQVFKALEKVTIDALNEDKEVKLLNGVTVRRVFKDEHPSRNPGTGESVIVPGKYVPRCRFSVGFKNAVK